MQMGVGIRQSVADVDTDSLLSENWPPSPPVRWRSCSETDSATTEKHGQKKTEKTTRNAMEFLISVDLGKVWPPLQPTRTPSPVSCIETLWEAPMQSTWMHREPEYDVEKFGAAAEVTDRGYRPATKAQQEMSARRSTAKGMKG